MRRNWPILLLIIGIFAYLASGTFNVEPDETGVTFLFGTVDQRHAEPGMHWNFPAPFGRRIVTKTATNLSVPLGYDQSGFSSGEMRAPDLWVTGGTSIVRARLDVQYTISDLADDLLSADQPVALLQAAGEQAITRLLTTLNVDDVLTTGRQILRQSVKDALEARLDAAHIGIRILSINIQDLSPPREGDVERAFQQVQSARSDRERAIQNAMAEHAKALSEAQAKVQQLTSQAAADKYSRIELAKGQSERFLAVAAEDQRAPVNTEQRLYLETMERLLPKMRLYVVEADGRLHLRNAN